MKLFTITFIIVNIALASSAFLNNKNNVFAQIQDIESTDFGKKLMDTIQLQIENKAPLDDVASLLQDLKQNLMDQNDQAQADNDAFQLQAQADEANFQAIIDDAKSQIASATDALANINNAIDQNEAIIANRQQQLEILSNQQQNLDESYTAEQAAYADRIAEHESVLDALSIIVPKLQSLQEQEQPANDEVLAQLAKIGHSNPIAALITVATSLDQDALANVIAKLQAIQDSVQASLEADQQAQAQSDSDYSAISLQISAVTATNQQELESEEAALADNQNQAQVLQGTIENYTAIRDQNIQLLNNTVDQAAQKQAQFETDTQQRNSEIQIVVAVQNIIATRLQNIQTYFLERSRN